MKHRHILVVCGAVIVATTTSGCATRKMSPVRGGAAFSVDVIDAAKVRISQVNVDWDGENIVVSGKMRRRHNALPVGFMGHVDITIVAPNGGTLKKVGAKYYPSRIPRKRSGGSNFEVSVPMQPSPGITIRVSFHRGLDVSPEAHAIPVEEGSTPSTVRYREIITV